METTTLNELSERIRQYALVCSQRSEHMPTGATSEIDSIADSVSRNCRRYQSESRPGTVAIPALRLFDSRRHCSAFLVRSGFYSNLPTTDEAAHEFARRLSSEVSRANCSVTSLVLIDGLELPTKEVGFSGGRLFELSEDSIQQWFEGRRPPGDLSPDRLIGVAALEMVTTANNPPWGDDYFHWESPARQVQKVAEPWLTYLNLFDARKCRTAGMYQRSDSLLHKESIQEIGVREPMWETQSVLEPDGEEYEYERLHRTLEIDDEGTLESLLNFLEAGRAAAIERSTHRFETALRYFSRVSEITLSHDLALVADLDECEDIIISAAIGLEAIFLKKREGGKKASLSARAAALLESDHTLQVKLGEDGVDPIRWTV